MQKKKNIWLILDAGDKYHILLAILYSSTVNK